MAFEAQIVHASLVSVETHPYHASQGATEALNCGMSLMDLEIRRCNTSLSTLETQIRDMSLDRSEIH